MARVLVISLSDLARDARVDRQIEALQADHEVIAAGYGQPSRGSAHVQLPSARARTLQSIWRGAAMEALRALGAARAAYWVEAAARQRRMALAEVSADLVLANDVGALPLAFSVAGGAPVVLDLHEYAPKEHEDSLRWRLLAARQVDALLRRYLPRVAGAMTVNETIADAYRRRYGLRPVVVTNAARRAALAPSATDADRIRMVHHGVAMRGRRLEWMIDLLELLDDRFTLDMFLLGDSGYVAELERRARASTRVRVHPGLPAHEIVTRLQPFDVGLYILAPTGFNNLNALPNKLFDFVQARLAVAIGPSPAMAELVRAHRFGIVADSFEPASMAATLSHLDADKVRELKLAAHRAADELNAERNAEIVRAVAIRALSSVAERLALAPQPTGP